VAHNLTVAPEIIIVKPRATATNNDWYVYDKYGVMSGQIYPPESLRLTLNSDAPYGGNTSAWGDTPPTSTVFTAGNVLTNESSIDYVSYLFATCPGVSKCGSYTGTGTAQTINCGFTAGARFVLIKRTDSTGDWYCWDSARGIVAGNDPYLLWNSTASEVTSTDYVDTAASGFELTSTAPAAINASGGTYIFLAIA
jgi:hypothetical protein